MARYTTPDESDLDRIARLIAELDSEESLLIGLDGSPGVAPTPAMARALEALREQRGRLEEELAEVWAKRCSQC